MSASIPELSVEQQASFWAKVDARQPNECWEWLYSKNGKGYGKFSVNRRMFYAHRIALEISGASSYGICVMHKCDNTSCCNPSHLTVGTQADNVADCVAKGRHSHGPQHALKRTFESYRRGDAHQSAKLSVADVLSIRADTRTEIVIASDYNVSRALIGMIRRRKYWRHIDG